MRLSPKVYEVSLLIHVDPEAQFLEVDNGGNEDVILELIKGQIYDLDDVKIKEIEVECLE